MRTRSAVKLLAILLTVGLPLVLAGCGSVSQGMGFDADGRPLVAAVSPFAGRWSGNWSIGSLVQSDVIDLVVGTNGKVKLAILDLALVAVGNGSGTISKTGAFKWTYQYAGVPKFTAKGRLTVADDRLTGRCEISFKSLRVSLGTIELSRKE